MTCKGFEGSLSLKSFGDVPATNSSNVWGCAFTQKKPWPQSACIPDYDIGANPKIGDVAEFEVENGAAHYEIIEACPIGCGVTWHCKLLPGSTWVSPVDPRTRTDARHEIAMRG